jgi:hypothetical protein
VLTLQNCRVLDGSYELVRVTEALSGTACRYEQLEVGLVERRARRRTARGWVGAASALTDRANGDRRHGGVRGRSARAGDRPAAREPSVTLVRRERTCLVFSEVCGACDGGIGETWFANLRQRDGDPYRIRTRECAIIECVRRDARTLKKDLHAAKRSYRAGRRRARRLAGPGVAW